jgi:ubiquinone/menaquinone biosynthesis C-methylase UbiE
MSEPGLEAIFEWDIATWSQTLALWDRHLPADLTDWHSLEVGARNGGLSLYLARKGATVICSDLTDPRDRALPQHVRWNVADRIEYRAADVTALPFEDGTFQLVAFKSVLGALSTAERQRRAMAEIRRVLTVGGRLLWAENLPASPLHRLLRRRFAPWASYWRYPSLADWQDWTTQFAESHLATAGVSAAFGRTERQRRWLAGVDQVLQSRCPRSWRYVVFGVARK